MTGNNNICKEHSGIVKAIENCEEDVKALWTKWDSIQRMIIGIFVTLSLNLIGVIFLLIRTL